MVCSGGSGGVPRYVVLLPGMWLYMIVVVECSCVGMKYVVGGIGRSTW